MKQNKRSPREFSKLSQLVRRLLRQFPVRQFVRHYCVANIKAIIPVPVPISKMLNGCFLLGSMHQVNAIGNFHGTTVLFYGEFFKGKFDMEKRVILVYLDFNNKLNK
jgi:hypothetical protein